MLSECPKAIGPFPEASGGSASSDMFASVDSLLTGGRLQCAVNENHQQLTTS